MNIRYVKFLFLSRGRKYFKVKFENGNQTYNVDINEVTNNCLPGQTYVLKTQEEVVAGYLPTYKYHVIEIIDVVTITGKKVEKSDILEKYVSTLNSLQNLERKATHCGYWSETIEGNIKEGIKMLRKRRVNLNDITYRFQMLLDRKKEILIQHELSNLERNLISMEETLKTKKKFNHSASHYFVKARYELERLGVDVSEYTERYHKVALSEEVEEEEKKKLLETVERNFKRIEDALLEGKWSSYGEKYIKDKLKTLKSYGLDVECKDRLKQLRLEFKQMKKTNR